MRSSELPTDTKKSGLESGQTCSRSFNEALETLRSHLKIFVSLCLSRFSSTLQQPYRPSLRVST